MAGGGATCQIFWGKSDTQQPETDCPLGDGARIILRNEKPPPFFSGVLFR